MSCSIYKYFSKSNVIYIMQLHVFFFILGYTVGGNHCSNQEFTPRVVDQYFIKEATL